MANLANRFLWESESILRRRGIRNSDSLLRQRYQYHFGVDPEITAILWVSLERFRMEPEPEPKHLLWTLLFLKQYSPEGVLCTMVNTNERTYRKWVWKILSKLDEMADTKVSKL